MCCSASTKPFIIQSIKGLLCMAKANFYRIHVSKFHVDWALDGNRPWLRETLPSFTRSNDETHKSRSVTIQCPVYIKCTVVKYIFNTSLHALTLTSLSPKDFNLKCTDKHSTNGLWNYLCIFRYIYTVTNNIAWTRSRPSELWTNLSS